MDHVGQIVQRWGELRPDLDPSPMLVVGRIHRLARVMDAALRPTFAQADLAPGDFDILAALYRAPARSLTAGQLHHAMLVTTGAITKQVDRLVLAGLVTRAGDRHDRRVRNVTLSAAGTAWVDRLIALHLANERLLLSTLSRDEEATLESILGLLAGDLEPDAPL